MSWCPDVSSRGMKWLCYDENGIRNCSLIEKLSITSTGVSKMGFKTVVLLQRNLTVIHWDDSLAALAELSAQLQLNGDIRTFPLCGLHVVRIKSDTCISNIPRAVSICNRLVISNIEIDCGNTMTDRNCLRLASMVNIDLGELSIVGAPESSVTFSNGIAHLLQAFGGRLSKLSISCMANVDLLTVFTYCPDLKILCLISNTSYRQEGGKVSETCFKKLEFFRFTACNAWDDIAFYLPENIFPIILGSPLLKSLTILSCRTLTDAVLSASHRMTKFEKLECVDFSYCHSITNSGLGHFKNDENAISFIGVYCCKLVDVARMGAEWSEIAVERNWKIKTHFVSFTEFEALDE